MSITQHPQHTIECLNLPRAMSFLYDTIVWLKDVLLNVQQCAHALLRFGTLRVILQHLEYPKVELRGVRHVRRRQVALYL